MPTHTLVRLSIFQVVLARSKTAHTEPVAAAPASQSRDPARRSRFRLTSLRFRLTSPRFSPKKLLAADAGPK